MSGCNILAEVSYGYTVKSRKARDHYSLLLQSFMAVMTSVMFACDISQSVLTVLVCSCVV